jgi:hypothetical protein
MLGKSRFRTCQYVVDTRSPCESILFLRNIPVRDGVLFVALGIGLGVCGLREEMKGCTRQCRLWYEAKIPQ